MAPFRFGVVVGQARSASDWVSKARRVEELGYSILLMPDTLGATLAPLPALMAAAAATERLMVGTYVLANDFRHPIMVARETATLAFLSNGRFELGLGAGRPGSERENQALGIAFERGHIRVERLAQTIQAIKALFRGEAVADLNLFPHPAMPPRLLVAGSGRQLLTLAAHEADSIALALPPMASEADFLERVGWVRAAAGDRYDSIELNLNLTLAGRDVPLWLVARMGIDPQQLIESGSPAVLQGDTDDMCAQLEGVRERIGCSYISVSDVFMEQLAPVVARLAGR